MNEIKKEDLEQEKKLGEEKLKKRKKNIIKAIVILAAAALVMIIASAILQKVQENRNKEKLYSYDPRTGDYGQGFFQPEDDIMKDADYVDKNRTVSYTYQGVGTVYALDEKDTVPAQARLFIDYFNAAINGDGKTLNTLFTEGYFKNNGKEIDKYPDNFAQQKIYAMEVSTIGYPETQNTIEGVLTRDRFKVTFLLKNNNGQFRPDLPEPEDGTVPVVFEVLTVKDKSTINHVYLLNYARNE
ncbi:MAG: hypothetical protein II135_09820 [Clostridia bacterium]|nr:hypothetical protein [Clostridia bacterium]